jgi:BarA-like signal transduction histidine kinase
MKTYLQVVLRQNSGNTAKRFKEMMQSRSDVQSCSFYRADECILHLQLDTATSLENFIQDALASTGIVDAIKLGQRYRRLSS